VVMKVWFARNYQSGCCLDRACLSASSLNGAEKSAQLIPTLYLLIYPSHLVVSQPFDSLLRSYFLYFLASLRSQILILLRL
jgi:hypothetical protein